MAVPLPLAVSSLLQGLCRQLNDPALLPLAAGGPSGERNVWRVSTAPTRGAELADLVGRTVDAETIHDWAGGLLWIAVPAEGDGGTAAIRAAVSSASSYSFSALRRISTPESSEFPRV